MKQQIQIADMTCVNCQNRIEKALSHLDGVQSVSVSYQTGQAEIDFDEARVSLVQITAKIEELDYQVVSDAQKPDLVRTVCLIAIIVAPLRAAAAIRDSEPAGS